MGQYYNALVKRGNEFKNYSLQVKGWKHYGEAEEGEPTYNGVKLMEHSYWGNSFMQTLTADLYHHKARVAWVGDYSGDYHWENDPENREHPDPRVLCWLSWSGVLQDEDIEDNGGMTLEDKYLVNHTKKIYVDGNEYFEANQFKWSETDDRFSCIHPLSLLTACGNGLGGGDYHDKYPDFNQVGSWCFDEISVEDEPPVGYQKENYNFIEE